MDRNIDLTDRGDFSTKRLPKMIKLTRLPWHKVHSDIKKIPWLKEKVVCKRCGSDITDIPWSGDMQDLCRKCLSLFNEEKTIWRDEQVKDKASVVFLSDLR